LLARALGRSKSTITTKLVRRIHADDRGTLAVGVRADFGVASGDLRSSDPAS